MNKIIEHRHHIIETYLLVFFIFGLIVSVKNVESVFDVNLFFILISIVMIIGTIFRLSIKTTLDLEGISQRRIWFCNNKIILLKYRCEWKNVTDISAEPFLGIIFVKSDLWETNCPGRMIILLGDIGFTLNRRKVIRFLAARINEEENIDIGPAAVDIIDKALQPAWSEQLAGFLSKR